MLNDYSDSTPFVLQKYLANDITPIVYKTGSSSYPLAPVVSTKVDDSGNIYFLGGGFRVPLTSPADARKVRDVGVGDGVGVVNAEVPGPNSV